MRYPTLASWFRLQLSRPIISPVAIGVALLATYLEFLSPCPAMAENYDVGIVYDSGQSGIHVSPAQPNRFIESTCNRRATSPAEAGPVYFRLDLHINRERPTTAPKTCQISVRTRSLVNGHITNTSASTPFATVVVQPRPREQSFCVPASRQIQILTVSGVTCQ